MSKQFQGVLKTASDLMSFQDNITKEPLKAASNEKTGYGGCLGRAGFKIGSLVYNQ
jgi:hypothetical protein